jgi:hypothetical protein
MDDNPPICPDFWPKHLWDLHFNLPHPVPNPVNYPIDINRIMAGLAIHTASYLLPDKAEAQTIRTMVEKQLSATILSLSKDHDAAVAKK